MTATPVRPDEVEAVLRASRALVAVSARSLGAAPGVTLPQWRMLVVLSAGTTTLSGLAAALDVAPSTALRMVDRLVAADLVRREVRPDDRRSTWLELTGVGTDLLEAVYDRRRRDLQSVLARMVPAERTVVAAAMTSFAQAADALWQPGAGGPDALPGDV